MTELSIQGLMDQLPERFKPAKAAGVNAVVLIRVSGKGGGDWTVTILNQECSVINGATATPNLTVNATAKDLLDIFSGKLNATRAYMMGRLKLLGNFNLAMRLVNFFQ